MIALSDKLHKEGSERPYAIFCNKDIYPLHSSLLGESVIQSKKNVFTVKFLNFRTPENIAVIYLKFKQRGQTLECFAKKMQME